MIYESECKEGYRPPFEKRIWEQIAKGIKARFECLSQFFSVCRLMNRCITGTTLLSGAVRPAFPILESLLANPKMLGANDLVPPPAKATLANARRKTWRTVGISVSPWA